MSQGQTITPKDSDSAPEQATLGLFPSRQETRPILAPLELIQAIKSRREAYRKCIDMSDLTEADVAGYLNIDLAQFSRILQGKGRHLDDDLEQRLEVICGNKIPTQWTACQDGYELKSIESDLERENRQLREDNERLAQKYEVAKELVGGRVQV